MKNSMVKTGGFYPSIMGPFVLNVQAAVVPAALYTLYHMFVKKTRKLNSSHNVNMPKTRKANARKHRGSGYLTDQQYFNPDVLPPADGALSTSHSSYSTATEIRPVLVSTFKANGGSRKGRKGTRKSRKGTRKGTRKGRKASRK